MASSDFGGLPDNWTFQSLLKKHLEETHPDPQAGGRTRAEILVAAIVQGSIKQAASGMARADLVKLLVEHVDGSEATRASKGENLLSKSLTDVQFIVVEPDGSEVVLAPPPAVLNAAEMADKADEAKKE